MLLFIILQFLNVILGTLKSICTIKANKHIGAIANMVSFTFYAAVIKQMGTQKLWFILIVTAITNLIGFYVADFIFNKSQKDKLWRITATYIFNQNYDSRMIFDSLNENEISYSTITIDNGIIFDIYSYTQAQSKFIKEVLEELPIKYHVIEISKKL